MRDAPHAPLPAPASIVRDRESTLWLGFEDSAAARSCRGARGLSSVVLGRARGTMGAAVGVLMAFFLRPVEGIPRRRSAPGCLSWVGGGPVVAGIVRVRCRSIGIGRGCRASRRLIRKVETLGTLLLPESM